MSHQTNVFKVLKIYIFVFSQTDEAVQDMAESPVDTDPADVTEVRLATVNNNYYMKLYFILIEELVNWQSDRIFFWQDLN